MTDFQADDARLAAMHGYEPCGQVNQWTRLAHNQETEGATPSPATIAPYVGCRDA